MTDKVKLFYPQRLQPRPLKALRVCFLRNGDQHFSGVNMVVSRNRFKDFEALLQGVTESLRRHVVLRSAITNICRIDGSHLTTLGCLSEGDVVICCCQYEDFIWIEYNVNIDFERQTALRARCFEEKLYEESLEHIKFTDLPDAIRLYIGQLKPIVQNFKTLIYRGRSRANWTRCIVKMVNKKYLNITYDDVYIEAEVLRRLQSHPNIIDLMYSVEEERYMYIVLERLDCDVGELLCEHGSMSEENARWVMRGTVAGLLHMHQMQIIHRDIKPENLLIRFGTRVGDLAAIKITDFGLATYYRGSKLYSCCGTPCYMAPELIAKSGYDYQADSWSLGVTLFCMLCGQLPFGRNFSSVVDIYAAIMWGEPCYPKDMDGDLSDKATQLIDGLLIKNPSKRLTIAEVKRHPFLV
ncbi:serine/threonine-protein kinase GD17699 [Drosophila eugracilis]|uniref:serine/threonine-protein kinase GD17699 n=1 Tax=Drosophila eugracilis TaxID=29029 RepID=UPI001BDB1579|nr:serine/threonine-protein kinase GD17699 [Drosophila eugracilis]